MCSESQGESNPHLDPWDEDPTVEGGVISAAGGGTNVLGGHEHFHWGGTPTVAPSILDNTSFLL